MSKRFGRNQKRHAREALAKAVALGKEAHALTQEVMDMYREARQERDILASMVRKLAPEIAATMEGL